MKQTQATKFIQQRNDKPKAEVPMKSAMCKESEQSNAKNRTGVKNEQMKAWVLKRSETDDMKTQFKYRKLRDIDQTRKFEVEQRKIRAELKKRQDQKKPVVISTPAYRKPEEQPMSMRQSLNEFLDLPITQVEANPETPNQETLAQHENSIDQLQQKQSIPEEIVIEPEQQQPQATSRLRPMLQKVFQQARPKFQINSRDASKDDLAKNRALRRELYCKSLPQHEHSNPEKPLTYHKLMEWKVYQDRQSHPAKYRRLAIINMSAKEICLSKDVELKEKEIVARLGNEYMIQARRLIKSSDKSKTEESVSEPTMTHRYIDYLRQVRQPRKEHIASVSLEELRQRARRLQSEALHRIEEYVDRRRQGLSYIERGPFEEDIDSRLIDSVRAKVACLDSCRTLLSGLAPE